LSYVELGSITAVGGAPPPTAEELAEGRLVASGLVAIEMATGMRRHVKI
jgi:hypothetical protein